MDVFRKKRGHFLRKYLRISDVDCLKFIVRNCGDVVNAFMENKKKKEHLNSLDPDETPQNAAIHQGLCYLPC